MLENIETLMGFKPHTSHYITGSLNPNHITTCVCSLKSCEYVGHVQGTARSKYITLTLPNPLSLFY